MSAAEPEDHDDDAEVVDALPVPTGEGPRTTPPPPRTAVASAVPARSVPVVQAAAVAATGFAAGAVTAAVVRQLAKRHQVKTAAKRPPKALPIVGTRKYLVDVHLLGDQ